MSRHHTTNKSPAALMNHLSDLFINIDYSSTDEKISLELFKSDMDQNSLVKHILINTAKFDLKNTAHIEEFLTTPLKPSLKSVHINHDRDKVKHDIKSKTSHEKYLRSLSNHINEVPERDISSKSKEERSDFLSLENGTEDEFFYNTLFEINTPKKKLQHRMLKRVKSDMNIALRYWCIETEKELSKRSKSDYRGEKRTSEKKHLTMDRKTCDELNCCTADFKGDCTNFNVILSPRNRSPKLRSTDGEKSKCSKKTAIKGRKIIVKSNTLELMKPAMKSIGLQTKIKKSRHKQICPVDQCNPKLLRPESKTEIRKLSNSNLTMLNKQLKQNVTILNKTLNRNLHKLDKQLKKNLPILNKPLNQNIKLNKDFKILSKTSHPSLSILNQDLQMDTILNENLNINQIVNKDLKVLDKKPNQNLTMSVFECVDIRHIETKEKHSPPPVNVRPTIPRRIRNDSPPAVPSIVTERPQIPRRFINEKVKSKLEESKIIDDKDLLQTKIGDCFNARITGQNDDQSTKQIADLCSYFKNLLEQTVKSHLNTEKMKEHNENPKRSWRRSRSKSPICDNDIQRNQDLCSNISTPNTIIEVDDISNRITSSLRSAKLCSCITQIPIEIEPELFTYKKRAQSAEVNDNSIEECGTVNLKNAIGDAHMYSGVNALQSVQGKPQESSLGSSVTFNSQVDIIDDQNTRNTRNLGDSIHAKTMILPLPNKIQRSLTSPNKQEFYKTIKKSASVISIVRSSHNTKSSLDLNATTITLTSVQKSLAARSKTAGSIRNSTFLFTKVNMDSNQDTCFKRRNNYDKSLKTKMKKTETRPISDGRSNSRNVSPSSPRTTSTVCPYEYLDVIRKRKLPSEDLNVFTEPQMNKEIPSHNTKQSKHVSIKEHSTNASKHIKEHSKDSPNSTKADHHEKKLSNVLPNNRKPSPNSATKHSEKKSKDTKYAMSIARSPRKYPAKPHEEKPFNLFGYYAEPEPEPQQIDKIDVSRASNTYLPMKHSNEFIGPPAQNIKPRIHENSKNIGDKFVHNKSNMTTVANEHCTPENKLKNNEKIEENHTNLQLNPKSKPTTKLIDEAHPKLTTQAAHLKPIETSPKPLKKRFIREPKGMSSFVSGMFKPGSNHAQLNKKKASIPEDTRTVKTALIPEEFGLMSSAVKEEVSNKNKALIIEETSTIKPIENISNIIEDTSGKNVDIDNYLLTVEQKISESSTKTSYSSSETSSSDHSNTLIPLKIVNPSDSSNSQHFYSAKSINVTPTEKNISSRNSSFSESKKDHDVYQLTVTNAFENYHSEKSMLSLENYSSSDTKKENEHHNNDSSMQTTKELKNSVPKLSDYLQEKKTLDTTEPVKLPNQRSPRKTGIPITIKRLACLSAAKHMCSTKTTMTDEEKNTLKNDIIKTTNIAGLKSESNSIPKTKLIISGDKATRQFANLVNKSTTNHIIKRSVTRERSFIYPDKKIVTTAVTRERSFIVSPYKKNIVAVKQKSFIDNYKKESKVVFNFERQSLYRCGVALDKKNFKNVTNNNINKTSAMQICLAENTKEANALNKNQNTTRFSRQKNSVGSPVKKNIEEFSKIAVNKRTTTQMKNHGSLDRNIENNRSTTSSKCTLNIRGESLDRYYALKPIQNGNTSKIQKEEANCKKPNQNNATYTQIYKQNTTKVIKKVDKQKKSESIPTVKKPNTNKQTSANNRKTDKCSIDNNNGLDSCKSESIPTNKKANTNKQKSANNRKTDKCSIDNNKGLDSCKSESIPTTKKPNTNKQTSSNRKTDKCSIDNNNALDSCKSESIPTTKKPNINKQTSSNNPKTEKCLTDNKIPLTACNSSHDWICVHKEDKYEIYKPISDTEKLDDNNIPLATSKSGRLLETLTSKDQDKVSENWVLHKSEVVPINLVLLDYKNPLVDADTYKINKITKALSEPFENMSDAETDVSTKVTKRRSVHTIPASIKKYFRFKSKNSQKQTK